MKKTLLILFLILITTKSYAVFNIISAGQATSATKAMQNWRHVNYGSALLPVDASGAGVTNTIDLGSTSYYFARGYISTCNIVTANVSTASITTINSTGGINYGSGYFVKIYIAPLGDWNMDATQEISLSKNGIATSNILSISAIITRDDATQSFFLTDASDTAPTGYIYISGGEIFLFRSAGSRFDTVNYDSTGYNRGYMIITYY